MKRGFTLIELMIVVAIVAIIGSIIWGCMHPEKAKTWKITQGETTYTVRGLSYFNNRVEGINVETGREIVITGQCVVQELP